MTTKKKAKAKKPKEFKCAEYSLQCNRCYEMGGTRYVAIHDYVYSPSDFLRFERWLAKAKAWVLER